MSSVPNAYQRDSKSLMQLAGANTGNYAFRHGLSSLTDLSDFEVLSYGDVRASLTSGPPSIALVSCANWLSATQDYEKSNAVRASIIESIDAPVIPFGLGAQAKHGDSDLSLGPNTIRLAHVLASKCQELSVRDEFTANVLDKVGVKNTCITGCPSNFINLDSDLGARVVERSISGMSRFQGWKLVRSHISEYSGGHELSGRVVQTILEILHRSCSFYVLQSPTLMPLILGESQVIPGDYRSNAPVDLRESDTLFAVLRRTMLHFSSIEGWLDFSRTCDIAFGMRIHGNMLPMQAGVPSIVIGHDSRTTGLSDLMGVPTISPEEFVTHSKNGPSKLYEIIAQRMIGYDTRRQELALTMKHYLEINGVPPSKELGELCVSTTRT